MADDDLKKEKRKRIKNKIIAEEIIEEMDKKIKGYKLPIDLYSCTEDDIEKYIPEEHKILCKVLWATNQLKKSYGHSFSDLLDRLTILQLKEVRIPENRTAYASEIQKILNDIDIILVKNEIEIDANFLRYIIILSHYNNHIWYNESEARKGNKDGNKLFLTHSLNGVRNRVKNKIEEYFSNGKKDFKIDCLAEEYSEWEPSW